MTFEPCQHIDQSVPSADAYKCLLAALGTPDSANSADQDDHAGQSIHPKLDRHGP